METVRDIAIKWPLRGRKPESNWVLVTWKGYFKHMHDQITADIKMKNAEEFLPFSLAESS